MPMELPVREPFPWASLLQYLSARLIPEVEHVVPGRYIRQTPMGKVTVSFDARPARLIVKMSSRMDQADIGTRIAGLFDVTHDPRPILRHLRGSPMLRARLNAVPGLRPLGAWSPFELCMRTILGQQVSVTAAGTLMRRLVERCGGVTPQAVVQADLSNMGMPGRRVQTLKSLATAAAAGRLMLEGRSWPQTAEVLATLPGVGPWTRAYLAIRLGREQDAFPDTDLGLIRGAGVASARELLDAAKAWSPYRAYAATYLWSVP